MITVMTEGACLDAVKSGTLELPGPEPGALILTQSWCPQWKAMKAYLPEAEKRFPGLAILYVEYDLLSCYEEFMAFKERSYNNREIPYVRYYRNGACTGWSNYVSLEGFLHRLESPGAAD